MTAGIRAVVICKMWVGEAALPRCVPEGLTATQRVRGRVSSAREAGETSANLPGTTPSVHQVERTWNGAECAGWQAFWQHVFHAQVQESGH